MATEYGGNYSLSNQAKNFKIKYGQGGLELYDAMTPLMSQIKKTYTHSGEKFQDKIDASLGGGVGGGTLPTPSQYQLRRVEFARKKQYYRAGIDREAIYASKDQGAFDEQLKTLAARGPKTFNRFIETQLFLPKAVSSNALVGGGVLGTIATGGVSGSNPYTLTLTSFKAANFEIGDIVNIETANTDKFEIQGISQSAGTITVYRNTGSQVPAQGDAIFHQGNENNGILGLEGNLSFASGNTLYGESFGYRYEPGANINAASAGINTEFIDEAALSIHKLNGGSIDTIIGSHVQWRKFAATMEGDKRYCITKPVTDIKGHPGFKGIEYVGPNGSAVFLISRFCDDDKVYVFDKSKLELKHTRGFGWFDDDGTVFMREANSDSYEARFGGYMELYFLPHTGGRIHTLSIS